MASENGSGYTVTNVGDQKEVEWYHDDLGIEVTLTDILLAASQEFTGVPLEELVVSGHGYHNDSDYSGGDYSEVRLTRKEQGKSRLICLSESQKQMIDDILLGDEGFPADETIGDTIKRSLLISGANYTALEEEIADYVENFFSRMSAS